jgi:hypothetical protein
MNRVLNWIVNKTIETAPKLAFQVMASIAATVCGAFVTGYYKPESRPVAGPQAEITLDAKAASHLLAATFTQDGFRLRPAYPVEFAAVYGIGTDKPYTALAAGEWSTPIIVTQSTDERSGDRAHEAAPTPAKSDKKPTLMAQTCSTDCGHPRVAVLPPPRPATLTQAADAPATAETSGDNKPVRLLGMSLPGFVPSGQTIARTVVSLSDTIVGVIPGL